MSSAVPNFHQIEVSLSVTRTLIAAAKRLFYGLRVAQCHLEQRSRRPLWLASALLPVLQCGYTNADHAGKLALGLMQPGADGLHVQRAKLKNTTGLALSALDLARLLYALHQELEIVLVHSKYSSIT